jgi:hypothetical protein
MFMYGSILIAVTLSPVVFRSRPVEDAVNIDVREVRVAGLIIRTNNTLPNTTDHTPRDENVLGHEVARDGRA